jgi:outer membrane protein assembly factor BamB
MRNCLPLFLSVLLLTGCTTRNNWNQYLGPNRNVILQEDNIARSWPEGRPSKLWEVPLGPGYGGASIYGNEVYVLDRIEEEADVLRCFDLASGKEKWSYKYEAEGAIPFPGSRTVPYVDRDYVWTSGPHGHVYCFSKKTNAPVWNLNIKDEFDADMPNWGFSQSPLIYDDLLILAPQGKKAGVTAFNKITGELVWKTRPLSGHNFHVSPVNGRYGGIDQVIMISPRNQKDSIKTQEVVGFDIKTGEELWNYTGLNSFATITPATVIDDKYLFLTDCSYNGNYNPVSILLEITKTGDAFNVKELFKTEEAGCKMHPAVYYQEHLYLNTNGRPNQMVCMSMTGEILWESGADANFEMGSMIMINGLIINQNGKNGEIHLIEPSPEGYKELGKASFFTSDKSQAWAPMAFAQGKLLARDMEKLVCVDLGE